MLYSWFFVIFLYKSQALPYGWPTLNLCDNSQNHFLLIIMWLRFTCICSNYPVLKGRLPFWEDNSHHPVSLLNLPFWDDPGLDIRYLWIFQVDHSFYKLHLKFLATSNKIRCTSCSWSSSSSCSVNPCQQKHLLFWHYRKKCREWVYESLQFVIFKSWKVLWKEIDYYWSSYCYGLWIFRKVLAKTMRNSTS